MDEQQDWPRCDLGHGDLTRSAYEDKKVPGTFGFYCSTQGCKCNANPDRRIWRTGDGGSPGGSPQGGGQRGRPSPQNRPQAARGEPQRPNVPTRDPNALGRAMNTCIMSAAQVYQGANPGDGDGVIELARRLYLELAGPVAMGQSVREKVVREDAETRPAPEPGAFDPEDPGPDDFR